MSHRCIGEEMGKKKRLWCGKAHEQCVGRCPHNLSVCAFAFTGITAAEQSLGAVWWFVCSSSITHLQVPMDYAHLMAV